MSDRPDVLPLFLVVLVFVPMLAEARRAARNEHQQRSRGGIEPPGDVYAVMRIAYPAAFLVMIAEALWRHPHGDASFLNVEILGLTLFLIAKALKWWAILSLGPAWTFRVIVVPDAPQVEGGPYAYLRHPNYVAVVLELAGIALASGAQVSGPLVTLAFGALMMKRIFVEDKALGRIRPGR
jgi:methyltransferase